jgi:putative membrane protein
LSVTDLAGDRGEHLTHVVALAAASLLGGSTELPAAAMRLARPTGAGFGTFDTAMSTEIPTRLPFLDARAKARAVAAVKAFELETSAELVITVKKHARTYPEVHLLYGSTFALLTLLFLLFYPLDFSTTMMPVDTLVGFALGNGLSRMLPPLQLLAISEGKRRGIVDQAAKAAFVDLGVSKTTGRTGVLVYVALFERMVSVVADAGVTPEAKAAAERARTALEDAVKGVDIRAFAQTLEALGKTFGETMQRSADDVNELPDEIA